MHISIPKHASDIIKTLSSHGYEAFVVGGCVRDSILGKEPADWDITTSALPEQVKALFPRTIDTGLKHGTVTIMMDKIGYEVTTYRIDGTYEDHRRPNDVTFTSSLREDLMRRDFTINAMAYNEEKGLVDLFGGIQDLNDRIIRCVGNPTERFDEDALRMFRAVRFAGQLNFNIEKETLAAIEAQHAFLKDVSAERIQIELLKLLISGHPEMIRAAYETGLTSVFLPEFDRMMERAYTEDGYANRIQPSTLEGNVVRVADIIAYLGKDRQDAARVKMTAEDAYAEHEIGSLNAEIINNLVVNIIENSYGKPYIKLDTVHFEALRASKAENYKLIYNGAAKAAHLSDTVRPMMQEMYGQLLDDLRENHTTSPIFTHHIAYVTRSYYPRVKPYADCDPNQIVVDYIASMTDDYFIDLHHYLFPNSPYKVVYKGYFDGREAPAHV